jgi:hypothetical protein
MLTLTLTLTCTLTMATAVFMMVLCIEQAGEANVQALTMLCIPSVLPSVMANS